MLRTVFFGTPAIAVSALDALRETTRVMGVVSQPDRPAGRGLRPARQAVTQYTLERDLPLLQPHKLRNGELRDWLLARQPEVVVVMAYGRILPGEILKLPTHGCLNLHASLLPKWRGAAPIPWAISSGDAQTGISLMRMDEGLDTGPVFSRDAISIGRDTTAGQLTQELATLAAKVIVVHSDGTRQELVLRNGYEFTDHMEAKPISVPGSAKRAEGL